MSEEVVIEEEKIEDLEDSALAVHPLSLIHI